MTTPSLPADRKVVFITPEELSRLPSDSTIYVLTSNSDTITPPPQPLSASISSIAPVTSISCSPASTNIPNSVIPNAPLISSLPLTPSIHCPIHPNMLGLQSYPPGLGRPLYTPYIPSIPFPCVRWPQTPVLPYAPSLISAALTTPPPNFPTANFLQRLPNVTVTVSTTACSNNAPPKSVSRRAVKNASNHNHVKGSSKNPSEKRETEPIRYAKMTCAAAPEYFQYDDTTGCFVATERMIDLENRFEEEVLARRVHATMGQPERKPLDRSLDFATCSTDSHRNSHRKKPRLDTTTEHSHPNPDSNRVSGSQLLKTAFDPSRSDDDQSGDGAPNEVDAQLELSSTHTSATDSDNPPTRHRKKRKSHSSLLPSGKTDSAEPNAGLSAGHARSLRQQREVAYKLSHPNRLHPDIWHNEAGEFNDGPACSCKTKYRIGPLHNQYEGEEFVPSCVQESNNSNRLHHYRVVVSPTTNFVQPNPTTICYDGVDYVFDGFSMFLHYKLDNLPPCQLLRFNLLYDIYPVEEEYPKLFTVRALDLLTQYIFVEILELLDLSWRAVGVDQGCPVVHLMPRFVHLLPGMFISHPDIHSDCPEDSPAGELLPINVVLHYLLNEALTPVTDLMQLSTIQRFDAVQWSNYIAPLRGSLATFPGKKPAAIRIDQMDRRSLAGEPAEGVLTYPIIVHMTYTPMKLSLTREPKYKCVLKNFMKLQYLMMNKPRISPADRSQLAQLASELEDMEHSGVHRREITVELSSEGFFRTGIRPDVSQHALNLVSLISHVRFHKSLEALEARLGYRFQDKSLLHQALTHPSYRRTNFGTNQDHFQNSLVSCGPRLLEYGDKLQLYKAWRKKGLTKMIQVMSALPKMHEERSNIYGNERLEFLGDAVIEVISSIHLFFMFPDIPEGNLDAYRQAIVQNQHLAELAVRLGIHKFLLYTHSVDFCYDSTFIYARSDAFEALMAAIALDAGLEVVDKIFGAVLFGDEPRIHRVWTQIPPHPLQAQYPDGDRSWASNVPMFKKLPSLEETLGITFKHLRVLARSMTIRKTGFNFYTLGDNQRLEFLGDSLLKYVSTDYLFRHFPRHHEGHLSLLKNSLVNKYTQAAVCSELGLDQYVIRREDNTITGPPQNKVGPGTSVPSAQNQTVKFKADLLEAFIGALFVDKDLVWVERFCQVCFWPRLVEFILKQEWNDAKSKLQQCCLTFRSLHEEPEIAHYKVLDHTGPTNQRMYVVGVYFRGERLATGSGRSVQQAQMDAAKQALEKHQDTFRQLDFQRSVIARRYKQPYIQKMLDQVENWDERLVDYFVSGSTSASTSGGGSADAGNRGRASASEQYKCDSSTIGLEACKRFPQDDANSDWSGDRMDIDSDTGEMELDVEFLPSGTLADLLRSRKRA